jgi:oxygen-independent coproporphyrinogen III oxidase
VQEKGQGVMKKNSQYPDRSKGVGQKTAGPAGRPCSRLTGQDPVPGPLSLYVHVPFCIRKCPYCDFFSVTDLSLVPAYVAGVCNEIRLWSRMAGGWSSVPVHTVYFGGGTPSLLTRDQAGQILDAIRQSFCLTAAPEMTVEVNPGTVDSHYLEGLRHLGINRLSIGAQSFDPEKLGVLSRIHTRNQVKDTLAGAARAGFTNLGLDLMYGLPGETAAVWQKDLDTALEYRPAHLSCYMLTLEPGTPFFDRYEAGSLCPCDTDRRMDFFVHTSRVLENAGYIHYEVSNFARGGNLRSIHNTHYWNRGAYLGVGPSAHSFLPGGPVGRPGPGSVSRACPGLPSGSAGDFGPVRSWNAADIHAWLDHLAAGRLPWSGHEILTPAQEKMEQVMLGLRTRDGIAAEKPDKGFHELMLGLAEKGLGVFFHPKGRGALSRRFRLTRSGLTCLDSIVDAFARQII